MIRQSLLILAGLLENAAHALYDRICAAEQKTVYMSKQAVHEIHCQWIEARLKDTPAHVLFAVANDHQERA